jgi:Ca2+-transporting ATPase
MSINHFEIIGLSDKEVADSRKNHGTNQLSSKKRSGFLEAFLSLIKEPMIILLMVTSTIYFISGEVEDGIFLLAAIVLVASISFYQDSKSRNALEKLKIYSQPKCKVIRNGLELEINSEEVVVGDNIIVEEGTTITADGVIIHSNDFSVNESLLTGESLSVFKDAQKEDHFIFRGTTVASGLAISVVTAVGNKTKLGEIGVSLENIKEEKTPLEIQISDFVKKMVIGGSAVFLVVWLINYNQSHSLSASLINALTLAMSILPEEIPVAFTTFMALGSWRLMKMGIIVKKMKTVETLGSATVICVDKTGTITENKMSLAKLYTWPGENTANYNSENLSQNEKELIRMAMWASEPIPFDPMEVALHHAYSLFTSIDERPLFRMIHEYPLGGKPPMMTHIYENEKGDRLIAAKGAPEVILSISNLNEIEKNKVNKALIELASNGYRVLAVGETSFKEKDFPKDQQDFHFKFRGLIAFYDPPKENIREVFQNFSDAGIKIKIITGDNAETTRAIAKQIQFPNHNKSVSGKELMDLSEIELEQKVADSYIFTRMFPEAKLKIINAIKARNEVVAMTGDGVNDGPALKASHIGIAMGKKGSEVAKQAASLILLEDDLAMMVDAISMGRKIYTNLKKAIQYIISIHIPIILTVFLPLALKWVYPTIFSPVHVILMELIMGPTCSIIYENEPIEKNTMNMKPRPFSTNFFNSKELLTSIIQGLAITIGILLVYQYAVYSGYNEHITRTMVFVTLISSNIFLTLVNRSFYYSILSTLSYKNNLVPIIIGITILLTGLLLWVKPFVDFFQFETLNFIQIWISIGSGFLFVIWYEIVKWGKRKRMPLSKN